MKKRFTLIATFVFISQLVFSQLSFYPDNYHVCLPASVFFTNTSSIGYSYNWNYGDGSAAEVGITNPSHTFVNGGIYTVTMEAYDNLGFYLGAEYATITVEGPASYISMPDVACPNDNVGFWVPVSATYYTWDFGDGAVISTNDQYTNHTYTTNGTYNVSMTYYNSYCGLSYTTYDVITIDNTLPNFGSFPGIYIYEPIVCPNAIVELHVNGNQYQSYAWDFGNGNFASENYVQTSYSGLGAQTISVVLTNGCGVDTTLFGTVTVDNTTPAPNVNVGGITEVCVGSDFFLEAYGPPGVEYNWDFGDGTPVVNTQDPYVYHSYALAGNYNVQMVLENQCGNTSTSFYTVDATTTAPVYNPYFQIYPPNVCPGDDVNFSVGNEYTFYIDFGDGTGASGNGGSNHAYAAVGNYPVSVIFQNSCGSTLTIYDTVHVQNGLPITNNLYLDIYPNQVCPGASLYFNAPYGYSDYAWNFGDGYASAYQQVTHPYLNAGNYNVSVTVTNGCGADTTLFDVAEVVSNLPVSNLDWGVFADEICPGNDVWMGIEDEQNTYDVVWDFGDGNSSTDGLTSHNYATPGNYTITLTATNSCGSDSTVTHNIFVGNTVVPDFSIIEMDIQSPGCIGDNLYFAVSPAGQGTYYWDFGDGEFGYSDQPVLVGDKPIVVGFHAYDAAGSYNATLTVTNACGNSIDTTLVVVVGGPGANVQADVHFFYDATAVICEGQPVTFFGVGAGTYYWDFGDGTGGLLTAGSLTPVEHVYSDFGFYQINVTGFNACGGTGTDNNEIYIPDSQIDVVTNTVQDSDCGVNNGVAIVSAQGGTQPYNYSWTNGDFGVIADSLESGIYIVTVTDNNGCSTEAITTVSDDQGPVILLENIVNNECFGQNNGVISASVLGGAPPYTILWSNGESTEDIYNLEAGPYEIFVTDANGCFSAKSFNVGQPEESIVSVYSTPADCGSNNGAAVAAISNGNAPFNFIWPNTTGTSDETSGLAPGVYDLLVIDGNTCLLQTTFAVNETNAPIIVTDSISDASCSGDLSAVYISTIGGAAPFDYSWSNSTTNEDLLNVLPGEYTVEVEGADGCSSFMFYNLQMSAPEETSICIVTVDSVTNSNIVVWVPVSNPDVVSYNIYKESSLSGLYYLVANQSSDSISEYYDYSSNPAIRSWRYKISSVDDCGNESELSDPHKTMHLTSNLGVGGVVNLIWDHYNGFDFDTYYINRYHPSTGWMVIDSVGSLNFSYTDLTPPSDSNLVYVIDIFPPSTCTAAKSKDHNSSRSNKSGINAPDLFGSGLNEVDEAGFSIYPNPTTGMVQILYSIRISEVKVFDLTGQLVYQTTNSTNTLSIDFANFADGIYMVQLTTLNGPIYSKIVKQ